MAKLKRGEMKERTAIKIPFEHLSEAVRQEIGYSIKRDVSSKRETLQSLRGFRSFGRLSVFGGVAALAATDSNDIIGKASSVAFSSAMGLGALQMLTAPWIQKKHEELKNAINKHGLLNTKFEGHYPINWMNSGIVAETHPVFYVTGRGDLVFKKPTRLEHMRYLDQQRFYGKTGLLPWRWRVYLEPPKAPQKIRVLKLAGRGVLLKFPGLEPAFAPGKFRRSKIV